MIKRFLVAIVAFGLAAMLIGCDNPETKSGEGVAYGLTGNSPMYAKIKVDGDGKILEAKFNEYLSVYDMGKLELKDGSYYKYGVEISEAEDGYAQFIKVGDKVFEYKSGKYFCDTQDGEITFGTYIECGGAALYIAHVKSGNFDIINGEGKAYNVPFNEYDGYRLDKKDWADKLKNGYREGVEYDNGWKEDIYKLATHLKNHGFYDYTGEEVATGKKGSETFKVGKRDTLVTLENFHDYMRVAQKAYEEARNNVK